MFRLDEQARIFGVTPLENLFITEYMPMADGDKIKVYLYGLYRSCRGGDGFDLKAMAGELNMEEGQILASLRYWERRRLVERTSDEPPVYVFHSIGQRVLTGQDEPAADHAFVDFSEAVYAQFGERRKLRPSDIALAYEWVQDLGLPQEVVLMLLNHAADTRGAHFSFRSMQPLAVMMKEQGIATTEEAEQYLSHSKRTHQGARAVLTQFNIRRLPTEPEMALYRKWTEEWGFDDQAVLTACSETASASNPSFTYLNGILERLKNKGGGRGSLDVKQQLTQEEDEAAQVKQVLETLGVFSISAYPLLPAWRALRERFSPGMILLAAKSVRARSGAFENIEPKLLSWEEMGLMDEAQVLAHLKELKAYEPLLFKAFERAGLDARPGEQDLIRCKRWISDGHSGEMILEAAEQARSSRQKMPYMEKVLDSWKKRGVRTLDEAKQTTDSFPRQARKVGFQDYDQGRDAGQEIPAGPDLLKEAREARGQ